MLGPNRLKDLYVPAPQHEIAKTPRPTIEPAIARCSAGQVMRSIPWSGEPVAPLKPPATDAVAKRIDLRLPTQTTFSTIPWTGEAATAPTDTQQEHSVRRILLSFPWE